MLAKEAVEAETINAEMRANKMLIKIIGDIAEVNKQKDIADRDCIVHQEEIRRLQQKSNNLDAEVVNHIYSAAVLISQLRDHGNRDMDMIFLGDVDTIQETRQNMGELIARLKFLYLVDPLAQLSNENTQIVYAFTRNWGQNAEPNQQNPIFN